MTIRPSGSRSVCKSHAGKAQALSRHIACSSTLYVGVPLTDSGDRDLRGSFLIFSVGVHTHPPPPIMFSTRGLLVTAAEVKEHHHISLAAEEEDVRAKLAEEYGRVVAAVPQTALRYARRQAAAERNPWGQGRDAALRMVARAVVAGDAYFRAPFVSDATAYIFPAFFESNVRQMANGVLAIETDEYYKAVESVGLSQDGDFFVLAISTTINNKGVTLARFFIQRATRLVARTCYRLFFQEVLRVNPDWAPWHVLVLRQLSVVDPALDGAPSAEVLRRATENTRRMKRGVLVGVTLDFSASLAGGLCDALIDVGFDDFDVDEHARSILFGCKAHANRVCDRAPLTVRATLRRLIECYNLEEAERLRALVIQQEPTRDSAGVLGNQRLLPAFCPAFSKADHLQREVASSTTNAEESQHERVYKLCGRRQPLMVAMTGSKFVDQRDAEELENGRAAGAYTSMEPAAGQQPKKRRRAAVRGPRGTAAELRIAELEKQLLEQRNKTLEAENAALRSRAVLESGGAGRAAPVGILPAAAVAAVPTAAAAAVPAATQGDAAPPAWFVNLMMAASQGPASTPRQ
ncbi:hypothetical protein I4F81_000133 [Pyropia yezoensis]|uniref:Uncharacterized protein n=1 Tax=Pyropia yezoensis TaxID=2788 RepID=A0ACC3BIC9_PYRYE|nr:hypothetical protein I4F81_000133 [Neopyropia yezoensis]